MEPIQILHNDAGITVCVKPVGLDAEHELPETLSAQLGGSFFPVHRLDRNVGGCMVFARTSRAAAELSAAVQNGMLVKEYIAQVHGTPPESGIWEDLLWKDSGKNKVFVVKRERKGVKKAKLAFTRLEAGELSIVRVRLHTGRSHQIRVQFSSRGYPLVGDHKYGARDENTAPRLWSCALTIPIGKEQLKFTSFPEWYPADR